MNKIFGELNLTWKKVIIAAVLLGIYTGVVLLIPFLRDTSFQDIGITFECWILFGILIIMNSKSPVDSALKCFVFFLISQPLVYLVQAPFHEMGFKVFIYYPPWFIWTLLTIPMGYIGYYLKKDKWWGLFILIPMILFLGSHYSGFFSTMLATFPKRLLSSLFCVVTMIIYPLGIFKDKKLKIIGVAVSVLTIIVMTAIVIINPNNDVFYKTTILASDPDGFTFDDTYKVSLDNESIGKVYIVYNEDIEDYLVQADFNKPGHVVLTIESQDGSIKKKYEYEVKNHSYDKKEINANES